jgi:hypothetical protein
MASHQIDEAEIERQLIIDTDSECATDDSENGKEASDPETD